MDRLKSAKDLQGRIRVDTEKQARLLDNLADSAEKLIGRKLQVLTDTFVGMQIRVARAEENTRAAKRELKKTEAELERTQLELKDARETAKAEAKQEAEALAKTQASSLLDEFKVALERQKEAMDGNRRWLEDQLNELKEQHRPASSEALEKQLKKQFDEFQGKIAQSEGLKDLFEDQFALLEGGIDEIKTSHNGGASTLDSVARQLKEVSSAVGSIQKKCGPIHGLEESAKDLKRNIMAVSTKTDIFPTGSSWDELKGKVDAIVEALPDIGKGVKSLGDALEGIPEGINTLKESARNIEGVREAREKDLSDLLTAVGDIGDELRGLQQQVAQTDERARKLHKEFSGVRDTELSGIQMNLTVVKDTVPSIADTVERIEGKISDEIAQKSALTDVRQMQDKSSQKLRAIEQSVSGIATTSALTEVEQKQDFGPGA